MGRHFRAALRSFCQEFLGGEFLTCAALLADATPRPTQSKSNGGPT